jgi:hypothetical protein
MRLTLRTLLSYLDDMLEPAQAKTIGGKVAESEQARDLVERIKQVTRRRRLTTPPTSGPGGMDANTIAEYLDNEVTPEKAAEVEQICLASDVHLAEVAACHQILTLVLGEPALVPPSAKQKMYALVKGPEAIPFRKPAKTVSKDDNDLSSEIEPDQDETLRLGVPAVGSGANTRNLWLIVGGSVLAVGLLIFAVWQLLYTPDHTGPKPPDQVALNDKKDDTKDPGKKTDGVATDDNKKTEIKDKKDKKDDAAGKGVSDKGASDKGSGKDATTDHSQPITIEKVEPKKIPVIAYTKASDKVEAVGKYVAPGLKDPAVLLQASDKTGWVRITDKSAPVTSTRTLVSLPGSKGVINLDSGVELTLWGNLPEVTFDPTVLESRAILHSPGQFDADLTLERGRIILRNKKSGGHEALIRIRFDNPTLQQEEHVDLTLDGGDAAVVVDRFCSLDRDEPFYEDPKDPARKGPTASVVVFAYERSAYVRYGGARIRIDRANEPMLRWQSRKGGFGPPEKYFEPPWLDGLPKMPDKSFEQRRDYAVAAHKRLAAAMEGKEPKSIFVALAEIDQQVQRNSEKEMLAAKNIAGDTLALWRHSILCRTAVDDVEFVFSELSQEKRPIFIRYICLQSIHQWLAQTRDHDYEFLKKAQAQVKKNEAQRVIELFHLISEENARKPATYQSLIDGLNNELPAIRMLSHWHLVQLAPAGVKIAYDPAMPRERRIAAVNEWRTLVPPGELPPKEPLPKKKDKGK